MFDIVFFGQVTAYCNECNVVIASTYEFTLLDLLKSLDVPRVFGENERVTNVQCVVLGDGRSTEWRMEIEQ